MWFKFADSLDTLDVAIHWSTQAGTFTLTTWGTAPMVSVSRDELAAFRDQITRLLEETGPGREGS